MRPSIRLIKVFGIPIRINFSWIFIFLLISYLLANQFGQFYPSWPVLGQWALAVVIAVAFFLSVLVHELSHSLVALRSGIPVRSITLFFFGGVSQLSHEARRPYTEFLITVVGPLSSIFLALVFGGCLLLLSDRAPSPEIVLLILFTVQENTTPLEVALRLLFVINLMLGLFNMLPGFPLDGGRVLRAVLWGVSGSYWRATQVAVRGGQVLGGLMVLGGVTLAVKYFHIFGISGAWMALIGGFLFSAATGTYRQERTKEGLRNYRVDDVMMGHFSTLPGDMPLGSPLVGQGLAGHNDLVMVSLNGRVEGLLTCRLLAQVPKQAWADTPLSRAMLPLRSLPSLAPGDSVSHALEQVETGGLGRLAVVRNGELLGLLSREDILRFARRVLRNGS